jgi:phospholipase/lecithinase/hemolysin
MVGASAQADSFSAIYAFGDSLSDAGNAFIATGGAEPAAPYSGGRFSNGAVWVQDLASSLGLPAVTPSLAGGTDYAVGDAYSGTTPVHAATAGDLPSQITAFQTANPSKAANANGLYTIWIGSNDLSDITSPNPVTVAADVAAVVGNIDLAINQLAGDGAKNFLILTVPDLGKTPSAIAGGPAVAEASSALSAFFDNTLVNGLSSAGIPSLSALATADGLSLGVVDTYSLIDGITADPAKFGLTDVTQSCLTGGNGYFGGETVCANPSQYLFWDQEHPTAAGQEIVAEAALGVTPEPATLTMMLGAAGVVGLIVVRRRRRGLLN